MPGNTVPLFSKAGDIQWSSTDMTAANTTADLTSGTSYTVWTADATNGGLIQDILFKPTPAGNTTTTVVRVWINNGSTTGTAANNTLIGDQTLTAVTASAVAGVTTATFPINRILPAGYKIICTLATASANGWKATGFGGKY